MADRAMEATTAARCRRKAPGREDRRVAHGGQPAHMCVGIDAALAGVLGCLASHRGVQHLASSGKVVKRRGGTDCEVGAASRRRRQTLHMGRLALAGAALTCTRCTSWPLVRKVLAAHETVSAAGGAAEGAGRWAVSAPASGADGSKLPPPRAAPCGLAPLRASSHMRGPDPAASAA